MNMRHIQEIKGGAVMYRFYHRWFAMFMAIIICFVFVFHVNEQKTQASLTATSAAIIYALFGLSVQVATDISNNPELRRQFTEGVMNAPQVVYDFFASSWETEPMYLQNLGVVTDEDGNEYVEMTGAQIAQAYSDIAQNMPDVITETADRYYLSNYQHRKPDIYKMGTTDMEGYWYVYENILITSGNGMNVKEAAIFLFVPTIVNRQPSGSTSLQVIGLLVDMSDSLYSEMVSIDSIYNGKLSNGGSARYYGLADIAIKGSTLTTYKNTMNLNGYFYNGIPEGYSQVYITVDLGDSSIGSRSFTSYRLVSDHELSIHLGSIQTNKVNRYLDEFSAKLNALMLSNAELAQTVIGVPVGGEDEGEDLPGLIAALRALSANQGADTQSLIDAIAQAAVEAAATTAAIEQTQEQIGELTQELTDIKEQVAEITEAVTTEVEVDIDDLSLPQIIATKFPFCIPFDLYNAFAQFEGLPREAPHWSIPINVQNAPYTLEIDMSEFDNFAVVLRWGVLILFNIGLIILTRKLIKG